jgi:hypothetical protein
VSDIDKVRKELTATRVVAVGLLVAVLLALYGVGRPVVLSALLGVLLIAFFLGCRWGIGDTELTLPQSIGATLTLALVFSLLVMWSAW